MDIIQRIGANSNNRYLIFGLIAWWLAMFIGYAIVSFRIDRIEKKIGKAGIEIAREFSVLVSLPLLEKKGQALHSLLTNAAKKNNLVYASVVDHQNRVVAFTGTGRLMPDSSEAVRSVEQVSIWEGGFTSPAKILNFAADVTYAGTKIGALTVGLSATDTAGVKSRYALIAVSSCLFLLLLFVVIRFPEIRTFVVKYRDRNRLNSVSDEILNRSRFHCPLCGTQKPFTENLLKQTNHDKIFSIGHVKGNPGVEDPAGSTKIDLHELSKFEDLSWLRRGIILRCTEIIKKIAA